MAQRSPDILSNPGFQRRFFFLAKRFVAGETIDSAIEAVLALNARGLSATLDFLGEDVLRESDAAQTTATYVDMIERIGASRADANVSVKLSAIGQAVDEDLAFANLRTIIEKARSRAMFVRLDMEGSSTVDSTYRLCDRARSEYEHVGPVVQAYLHRALADTQRHVVQHTRVRLCKGAYKEPQAVAFQAMPKIRENYLQLARLLLAQGTYPGIATHDDRLIEAVKAFTRAERIGPERFEFQMLYGIRPEKQRAIVAEGYRMRVYVPFGTHWAGYFYRRLAERKENVFFVLRGIFSR
ncbi:MAG TPA: proline dehydrogenase family protein [Candidatus Eremiobacteraceae bacterium]|nr:proline dehydrogenase family protein [Candidatus Eremiobacteraceae bacterium]